MIVVITIVIIVLFGFKIINKSKELNTQKILNKGNLESETVLKGDIFHKGSSMDSNGGLLHLIYVRLEDGKEIVINESNLYSMINTGSIVDFNKEVYVYKSQKLTFYSASLNGFEDVRLCQELDFIN